MQRRPLPVEPTACKRGRPTAYKPEYDNLCYKLRLLGLTVEEIANILEVNITTIYEWRDNYSSFSEAWFAGGDAADAEIAKSLYQRAKGYSHKAVQISMVFVDGQWQENIVEYTKHYPPDAMAASKWLAVRRGKQWRLASLPDEATSSNAITIKVLGGLPEADS
jgi:transposase-like protein